jgi:hypothetical protein
LLFRSPAATPALVGPASPPGRGVTRRRLLATGGAAGAAAAFGLKIANPDTASAADQGVPDYLVRSPYLALSTPDFSVGVTTLKLEAVTDLPAASEDPKLVASEDAFSLVFSAAAPLESAIQAFSHPDLGQFEFFVAPIEGKGLYEVVVNRSVNAPKHVPRRAQSVASGKPGPAAPPKPGEKVPGAPHVRAADVKRVSARRLSSGFACEVALTPGADVKSATVWITRGGVVVASTHVKHVHGNRIAARVPSAHRPRGGRYAITVATKNRHGHTEYKVAKLSLQ